MTSFRDLPRELRDLIYVLLFTADDILPHDDLATYLAPSTCAEASPSRECIRDIAIKSQSRDSQAAFLRTCRLVNNEASPLLYRLRPLMLSLRPESYIPKPAHVTNFGLTFASLPRSYLLNYGLLSYNLRSIENVELSLAAAPQVLSIRNVVSNFLPLRALQKPNSCHIKLYYDMSSAWDPGTTTMLQQLLDGFSSQGLEVFRSLTFSAKLLNMSSNGWSARADDFAEPDIDAPDEGILTAIERILSQQYGEPTEWDEVVAGEAARRITFYPRKYFSSRIGRP